MVYDRNKVSSGIWSPNLGPLAADLCIMVLITVLCCMKNFTIYLVILLTPDGATLGYNLFIFLKTVIIYFHTWCFHTFESIEDSITVVTQTWARATTTRC